MFPFALQCPPLLAMISVQLYWMIATSHWMGAVYSSVLHGGSVAAGAWINIYIHVKVYYKKLSYIT